MTTLQSELQRLHFPTAAKDQDTDANGLVWAMVLELAKPANWNELAKVWQGVQIDLDLPAPAIAVSGLDGYQLWFSLSEPLPAHQALAFLDALRMRYLSDIALDRVGRLLAQQAPMVPALQTTTGNWSAFVAPDLAPVFAETPWLDVPPSASGQSDLLSRLERIKPADFQRALKRLQPPKVSPEMPPRAADQDPKGFLLNVMNNDTLALSLRIEAAKALLPYFEAPRCP